MKKIAIIASISFCIIFSLAAQNTGKKIFYNEILISVINPASIERNDELISIKIDDLKFYKTNFNKDAFIIYQGESEVPSQIYKEDEKEKIIFAFDLPPNDAIDFSIKYLGTGKLVKNYNNRTYAEIAMKFDAVYDSGKFVGDSFQKFEKVIVPEIHTDHDALFKYEGPGWESEKVGYRLYIDWRNATDIFGKKVNELVLHEVGVNDLVAKDESYHQMQDWGMDVLKVGSSLGIGSIGTMQNGKIEMVQERDQVICTISANGPLLSEVTTEFKEWNIGDQKVDLTAHYSISAGSRITNADLSIKGKIDNITTGIAKHENTVFTKSETEGNWQYIALYGKQALSGDDLGIVIFFEKESLKELGEDELNHFVSLFPYEGKVSYKYAAVWEQELNGIKTFSEF
ncbi:MAG: DUF4861 family protein, partial [Melioribacteraceae bacterium]|nr:DUF4861 family protein [Melioribacteraceae bacterium]